MRVVYNGLLKCMVTPRVEIEKRTMSPSFVRTYLRVGDIDNVIVVNSHHAL
jgi:hypothetical protein